MNALFQDPPPETPQERLASYYRNQARDIARQAEEMRNDPGKLAHGQETGKANGDVDGNSPSQDDAMTPHEAAKPRKKTRKRNKKTRSSGDIDRGGAKPKSILKSTDGSASISRTSSGNRVNFKRQLEFYSENSIDTWSLLKYVMHRVYDSSPFWHDGQFENTWNEETVLQLNIPSFSLKETLFFMALFLATFLIPICTLIIPIKASSTGKVLDNIVFSLATISILGWCVGCYVVFYLEQFFASLVRWRLLIIAGMGPVAFLFHFLLSLAGGMMLPYGADTMICIVVAVVATLFYFLLPQASREKPGFKGRLIIGSFVLTMSFASIHLLSLMEAAKTRGPQVAYLLVLILPLIFTRLTTDMQEALPYTSAGFSMIAQGFLTWLFSSTVYSLLVALALEVPYYNLYAVYLISDLACICGVGPIWSLWSTAGYLRTSKFAQTIFGWAQNPIKPKPVLVKYFTRTLVATVYPLIMTAVYASDNKEAFASTSDAVLGDGKLPKLWITMMIEVATSLFWVAFVYRLMKVRCAKDAFNGVIIQFSKNLPYILIGGTVVSLHSVLIRAKPSNSGFLS
ncbi:hypothetical protein BSKO_12069 [Bryopsis sp. KO-2023]|nr:hypothetical protein BSKO_12069 [Bryopsis sp. KO-2023]